jgi:hypothetical protein
MERPPAVPPGSFAAYPERVAAVAFPAASRPCERNIWRPLVSLARDQDIEDIAVLIYCSPKIMAFAAHRYEQLLHVPGVSESTLSTPQSSGILPVQTSYTKIEWLRFRKP